MRMCEITSIRIGRGVIAFVFWWLFSSQSWADNNSVHSREWAVDILEVVSKMPRMKAIEANLAAARSLGKAGSMPVYNPEIGANYDDKSAREYTLSAAQTIDWSGKREARTKVADADVQVAVYQFKIEKDRILADALKSISEHATAKQILKLAKQQTDSIQQLADVVDQRYQTGDLGILDVELARFTLSESYYQFAQAQSQLQVAIADLEAQLGSVLQLPVPEFDWADSPADERLDGYLQDLPSVLMLSARLDAANSAVEVARSESKADPTLGLGTGKDGDESVVQLSFSIPLYARNQFTHEIEAKRQEALSVELTYMNERRVTLSRLAAASKSYQMLLNNWRMWKQLTGTKFNQNEELLQQLWESGEIETATYVFGQQQRTQAMLAGVEFKRRLFDAWIEWLQKSGQVDNWLKKIAQQDPEV